MLQLLAFVILGKITKDIGFNLSIGYDAHIVLHGYDVVVNRSSSNWGRYFEKLKRGMGAIIV